MLWVLRPTRRSRLRPCCLQYDNKSNPRGIRTIEKTPGKWFWVQLHGQTKMVKKKTELIMTGHITYFAFVMCLLAFVAVKYGWLVVEIVNNFNALMGGLWACRMKTYYDPNIDDAWQIYYMDNNRQKKILHRFHHYQAAVSYAQQKQKDYNISLEVEPTE